jgi:cell division protein CrgA
VPESSSRKTKKSSTDKVKVEKTPKKPRTTSRVWVAPLMLGCWLLGLAWLVVFYVAGQDIPVMKDLGNWNLLIGMGLIAVGFVVSTQWV